MNVPHQTPKEEEEEEEEEEDHGGNTSVFPKAGIKLSFLINEFREECGGSKALEGITTHQVCEQFIKPATQHRQCSYCDLLQLRTDADAVVSQKASVFISHAHQYDFLNVVNALQWHLRDNLDIFIWFDIFSINQHTPTDWTFDWLSTTFKSTIEEFGHTIMVMSPWNNPIVFTRAWCIFELWKTAAVGNKFEIAMGHEDRMKFLEDVTHSDTQERINQVIATIQAEKSQCSVEEDREHIFSSIRRSEGGFDKINSMVFEQYRDWVITVAMDALQQSTNNENELDQLRLTGVIGKLYLHQGNHQKAMAFVKKWLKQSKALLGEDHPETLCAMHTLIRIYHYKGEYGVIRNMCENCLNKRIAVLGEDHPHTIDSMIASAMLHDRLHQHFKARTLLERALEKRIAILGGSHIDTLRTMHMLALHYSRQKKYDKALPLHEECVQKRTELQGENHPETLASMNSLAIAYQALGGQENDNKVLPLLRTCLEKRKSRLGENHPLTLSSLSTLAMHYTKRLQHDKALPLLEECARKRRQVLGHSHNDTLWTMSNLAASYLQHGMVDQASRLAEKCFKKRKSKLGDNHYLVINSMKQLTKIYEKQGEDQKAQSLRQEIATRKVRIIK